VIIGSIKIFQCCDCDIVFRGDHDFDYEIECPACHKANIKVIAYSNDYLDELFDSWDCDDPFLEAKIGGDR
jgi:hypothetical protein